MKNKISENQIIYALVKENAKPDIDFKNQLKANLNKKISLRKPSLINILIMKNKSLRFKMLVIIPTLLILSISTFAVTNPAKAGEILEKIKECQLSPTCYDTWTQRKNAIGKTIDRFEKKDPTNGVIALENVDMTANDQLKLLEQMGGKKVEETKEYIIVELPSGSRPKIIKSQYPTTPAFVEWWGAYRADELTWGQLALGMNPEKNSNLEYLRSVEKNLASIDITKAKDSKVLKDYYRGIQIIKVQSNKPEVSATPKVKTLSDLTTPIEVIYEYKGKEYIYQTTVQGKSNIKVYEKDSRKFILEIEPDPMNRFPIVDEEAKPLPNPNN